MKTPLIKLSDGALARRMVKYIEQAQSLEIRAEYYLDKDCPSAELEEIRRDYIRLKSAVRSDAEELSAVRRGNAGSRLCESKYMPSVTGAAAWALWVGDDCTADKELLGSVRKAIEKLTGEYPEDYWRILAQKE